MYIDGEHRTGDSYNGDPVWSSFHRLLLSVHLGAFRGEEMAHHILVLLKYIFYTLFYSKRRDLG